MDVVVLRWPEEVERLEELRALAVPRLLLVAPESDPPAGADPLEDWVRMPAEDRDVRARVATLAVRAPARPISTPVIDGDGLVWFGGAWIALSPVERAIASALVERFGAVVGRDSLVKRVWPEGAPTRNALDVHMLRLRRRLEGLGLEVRTVRARGYLLQPVGSP